MAQDKQTPRSKHNIIEELRSIRKALHKAPESIVQDAEIPVLDEIIEDVEKQNIDAIPILADSIVELDDESHELALNSWKLVEKELYQLITTMDNPMSSMTQDLLREMSSQLAANWEAIFSSQSQQMLQHWKQLLLNHPTQTED
jgi:hypothetical protein